MDIKKYHTIVILVIIAFLSSLYFPVIDANENAKQDKTSSVEQERNPDNKEKKEIKVKVLEKANEDYKSGKYDEALKKYTEAAADNPDHPVVSYNIGNVLYKKGKIENALKKYETAKSINDSHYNRGNAYYKLQKPQEALASYKEALIKNPSDMEAKFNYEFIRNLMEKQKNDQNQQNKDDKNQNKDNQDNKDNKQQDKKDKQDQKNKDKKKEDKKQQEQQKKKQEQKKIDPKQAQAMLRALKKKEKDLMKKMIEAQKAEAPKTKKDW